VTTLFKKSFPSICLGTILVLSFGFTNPIYSNQEKITTSQASLKMLEKWDRNISNSININSSSAEVGSLKGKLSVTGKGALTYSIPISVPPGTADMTPALAIQYNSQSGDGLLGMGFGLDGLTVITRCPANRAQNGEIHGVDYTAKDRFCLNGQQLVAIKGAYGANGTEYRTYTDTQTRIISYG